MFIQESLNDNILHKNANIKIDVNSDKFKNINKEKYSIDCSICKEDFENTDDISITNCNHIFHTKCIKEWGYYKQECPNCRNNLPIIK